MNKMLNGLSAACCAIVFCQPAHAQEVPQPGVQVVARTSAQVGSPMSGTIEAFPLLDGNTFKKGDLVARFQCSQQDAALAHARAQEIKARGVLSTQQQLRDLHTYSQVEYKTAAAELQASVASVSMAAATRDLCTVKAPFDGRVSNVLVHAHQFVQAGAPMIDLLANDGLEMEAIVPSIWLAWLKTGEKFDVSIRETGRTYHAEVVRVGGRVDAVSGTVKVYGRVAEGDGLLTGMSGTSSFPVPATR